MDLKEILAVSGRKGLYKLVSNEKNRMIVEALDDKVRIPVFASSRPSSLNDICIFFNNNEDMPLKDVFKLLFQANDGCKIQDNKIANDVELKKYMAEVLPEYDKTKVHVSDMKKLFAWYNILLEHNLLSFDDTEEAAKTEAEAENKE